MAYPAFSEGNSYQSVTRVRIWYACLVFVFAIFFIRLFYLQIIRQDYYKAAALIGQLKQYEVPAARGTILAYDGDKTIPIVLNEKLYTLYADPAFVKDVPKTAAKITEIIGGDTARYDKLMQTKDSRYVILAKKLSESQRDTIMALEYPGLGAQRQDYRTYPQGTLASQVLGFVNDEGKGMYGIEQALNDALKGKAGELKAITDVRGVPLAANGSNLQKPAEAGKNIVLTLDIAMQKQLEILLEKGVKTAKGETGSAVIMDVKTGAVKAMANYPSYDPAKFFEVEDGAVFTNGTVANPIEIGSIMKPLTTAAALDKGSIRPDQTYADPARYKVDDFFITNIEEDGGPGMRSITDILSYSLNTGATWELMQMGGGSLNMKGRSVWYDYMANRFRFGKSTGIEQGYEAEGYVPRPEDNGAGINLTYANTSFGQAMTATPLQVAGAFSAVLNGGTYYRPHLVSATMGSDGSVNKAASEVLVREVVSPRVTRQLIPMMQRTIETRNLNPRFDQNRYIVGGKTGTAQIAKPNGGYYENQYNGTYMGFVGGASPQYAIVVFVQKPKIAGYAGSAAAQPIFVDTVRMLINNSFVTAKN